MWTLSKPIGLLLVLLAISQFGQVAQAKYGGGSGTAHDPYQIATAADLLLLGDSPEDYDKHFILTEDIDLDPNLFGVFDKAVIAPTPAWQGGTAFTGVFDGNDHTISHLTVTGEVYLGLFGQLEPGAKVKDLGLVDVNITGSDNLVGGLVGSNCGDVSHCYSTGTVSGEGTVGGLVAYNWGTISTSYSTGTVTATRGEVGGLVGSNWGTITTSYSTATVTSVIGSYVGGLVGWNSDGRIATSYSTGTVSGNEYVGGLVGVIGDRDLPTGGTVAQCYSTGPVRGNSFVGGLVGSLEWWGTVGNCYSTGTVSGTEAYVGGLVGSGGTNYVYASFWDIETSGQATSDGGTGKTTTEMQMASTFLEAGWDFVNVWGIGENQTYPYLRKYSAADINQDASVNFLDLAALAENWLTGIAP